METINVLAGVIIGLVVILCLYVYLKRREKNKEKAAEFIVNFENIIFDKMIQIISENVELFFTYPLEEVEEAILKTIYDTMWDYIETESQKASKDDQITNAVFKVLLNRQFVDNCVTALIDRFSIKDRIESNWNVHHLESTDESKEEVIDEIETNDHKLEDEFSNKELYNTEEFPVEDLEPKEEGSIVYNLNSEDGVVEDIKVEEEELPEEVEYSDDDDTVELLNEDGLTAEEVAAGVTRDKNGRKRLHGRFVK